MKNLLNKLLILIFTIVLVVPGLIVRVDAADKSPIIVYFFHGDGCPHCAEAEEWFESVKDDLGQYFTVEEYEVWYNEANNELMHSVGDYLGDNVTGVPYIVIGEHSFKGFGTSLIADITSAIMEEYDKDESKRINVVPEVIKETGWASSDSTNGTGENADGSSVTSESKNNDALVILVFAVIAVAAIVIIIKARSED